MTNFYVKVTKSLITDFGIFNVGDYIEVTRGNDKYVGILSDFDEAHGAIIVDLLEGPIKRTIFELSNIDKLDFVICE